MISAIMDHEQGAPADFKNARRQKANLKDATKEDRLPPHDEEAEKGVLGCCIMSGDCVGVCIEKFKGESDVFYVLKHKIIYEALVEMFNDKIPIDTITLRSELLDACQLEAVGGLAYVAGLPDCVPSAANLDHYIEIVQEKYVLRRGIYLATEFVGRAYEHQGEVDQVLGEFEQDVRRIVDYTNNQTTLYTARILVPRSIEWFEQARDNRGRPSGIPTGLIDFDHLTSGLQLGEMIVIAARPSTGKSSLVMNMAEHITLEQRLPVIVFSLEMSAIQLMNRTICSRARVNLGNARDGRLEDRDFSRLTAATTALLRAPLYIDDEGGLSIAKLRAKARRYHQQHGVRLIIIDYLQLLTGRRNAESRQQEVAEISAGLKNLAKELNVPVVVACQLNREVEKDKKARRPRMSDIRESGAIENDADVIGFLYKPPSSEDDGSGWSETIPVNLLIAKNRNGRIGDIPLTFIKSYTRFENAARADAAAEPTASYPHAD